MSARMATWIGGGAVVFGVAALIVWLGPWRGQENSVPPGKAPRSGNSIKLGAAESYGIRHETAKAATWRDQVTIYGRLVPNPRGSVEVRAPYAGTVQAGPATPWPTLGTRVYQGQIIGELALRFSPQERLDVQAKLAEAKARLKGAEEQIKIQQERLKRLESVQGGVPRGELDSAMLQLADARAQFAAAGAAERLWTDASKALDRKEFTAPLLAPMEGEIVELAAQPGVAVQADAVVARVVDFRWVLARLEFPATAWTSGPPANLQLLVVGAPSTAAASLEVRCTGNAPQVDPATQRVGCWYETQIQSGKDKAGAVWRPGLAVTAQVPDPASSTRPAVAVPPTALLLHQGRTLVYVRVRTDRYERREVQVLGHDNGVTLLASGVRAGEEVVSRQAQILLSEEFRGDVDDD